LLRHHFEIHLGFQVSHSLKNWEVTSEGYLEASTGVLPGGKVGFKAAIKFGSG
jgi:hypothetical protein